MHQNDAFEEKIEQLQLSDYEKCQEIWDMQRQRDLADKFYAQLCTGNRVTYIYKKNEAFIGEISMVYDAGDADYTIPNQRIYLSRLIVRPAYRRQGIGRKLVDLVTQKADAQGYSELSVGVDLDNYPAFRLYAECGFDKILFVGQDEQGRYVKLLKTIQNRKPM